MTRISTSWRLRAPLPLISIALAFATVIPGCAPTLPANGPTPETGEALIAAKPVDPKRAEAQQLLDELALSILRATGRVVPEIFQLDSDTSPILLSAQGQGLIHGPDGELVASALQALNQNDLAKQTLAKGLARAKDYCSKKPCSDENYKVELRVIAPPLANSDVLIRVAFSGDPTAVCTASQLFELLYRIDAPEPSSTCESKQADRGLRVRAKFAQGLSTEDCVDGTNVQRDTPTGLCCYILDKKGVYHWGNVKDKPVKRCDLQ